MLQYFLVFITNFILISQVGVSVKTTQE